MEDGDSDAEMADYGTDFSDDHDVDPKVTRESGIDDRIPRFPVLGGISRFPIPDSRFPIGRESWSRGHHAGDFLVWLRVSLAVVHQSSTAVCLPVTVQYGASRRSTRVQPSRFSALATQHSEPYYSTIQARVLCTV